MNSNIEIAELSFLDCENFFTEEFSGRFFSLLPEEDTDGDILHKCGRLLLRYMAIKSGVMSREDALKAKIEIGENGKPYFTDGDTDFSISHSGRLVGCALMRGGKVGFDLQERKIDTEKAKKLALRFFSEKEQAICESSGDYEKMFHMIWTKKEALIKYHGICFENSEISDTTKLPSELCMFSAFMSQEKESYAFSLCCKSGIGVAQPRFVMPGDILATLGS